MMIGAKRALLNRRSRAPVWVLRSGAAAARLDIDFVNDRAWNSSALVTIASLLSCARAFTSYYTKADGTLQSFGSNTLRYGDAGLLVEDSRTNLMLQSEDAAQLNGGANGGSVTITADSVSAPNGAATADTLAVAAGASGYYYKRSSSAVLAIGTYTGSIWLRAATNQTVVIRLAGSGGTLALSCALTTSWQRFTVTVTTTGVNYIEWGINNRAVFGGDELAHTVYVWGWQLELGSVASSYIPTTTLAVTRPADIITFSDLTWFDGAAESIYAEWITKNLNNAKVWSLDAANDVFLDEQTGMSARLSDAGATFAATVANTRSVGAVAKIAARMATNDIAISMNAGTVATDTSATQPGTLAAARLGCDLSGANHINSYIRRVAAWKSILLSNADLQVLL